MLNLDYNGLGFEIFIFEEKLISNSSLLEKIGQLRTVNQYEGGTGNSD